MTISILSFLFLTTLNFSCPLSYELPSIVDESELSSIFIANIHAPTINMAPIISDTPNLSPTNTALVAAANNGSVVNIILASVALTRWKAIDSTHNANDVVTMPV